VRIASGAALTQALTAALARPGPTILEVDSADFARP
jgi:hypothetical protein